MLEAGVEQEKLTHLGEMVEMGVVEMEKQLAHRKSGCAQLISVVGDFEMTIHCAELLCETGEVKCLNRFSLRLRCRADEV